MDTFQTPSRWTENLPDTIKTPSRHLPDTFESPTRNFKNFRHLTDIQNMIILLNHFRHFCETYQTHWIPSRHLSDTIQKLSKYLLDMVKPIATFAFVVAVPQLSLQLPKIAMKINSCLRWTTIDEGVSQLFKIQSSLVV